MRFHLHQVLDRFEKMTAWASHQFRPNHKVELGTLASNEDTVIITLNHAICDGKYIAGVSHHIGDPRKTIDSYLLIHQ